MKFVNHNEKCAAIFDRRNWKFIKWLIFSIQKVVFHMLNRNFTQIHVISNKLNSVWTALIAVINWWILNLNRFHLLLQVPGMHCQIICRPSQLFRLLEELSNIIYSCLLTLAVVQNLVLSNQLNVSHFVIQRQLLPSHSPKIPCHPSKGVPSERLRLVKRFISHKLHTGAWVNLVLHTYLLTNPSQNFKSSTPQLNLFFYTFKFVKIIVSTALTISWFLYSCLDLATYWRHTDACTNVVVLTY